MESIKMTPSLLTLHNGPFSDPPHLKCKQTLFIGCGGLGTSVVNQLKGKLQEYVDTHNFKPMRFLATDTAQSDRGTMKNNLETSEIIRICADDLTNTLDNIQNHPEIDSWFRRDSLTDKIISEIYSSVDGSGTTRPFGRVSFFEKANIIQNTLQILTLPPEDKIWQGKHGEVIDVDSKSFHIYIISSLSGGTGAGMFLDMAAMLRHIQKIKKVGQGANWHIFGVFILPEVICADQKVFNHNRLWANAYAALKEVDHFLSGHEFTVKYKHWDQPLTLSNIDYDDKLFNMVFLADRTDHSEIRSRDDMCDTVAEFLFYHTFTQGNSEYFNRYIDSRASLDFIKAYPSKGDEENQHLTLYSTFGINTLYLPTNKIIDYCTARLCQETFRFLCFRPTTEVQEKVDQIWPGSGSDGGSLLKKLFLDEEKVNDVFGLKRNRKEEMEITGRLNTYANDLCRFIEDLRQPLANRPRWRLWQRRVDVQQISSQIENQCRNLTQTLTRLAEDPGFYPESSGASQSAGSRGISQYRHAIEEYIRQIIGTKDISGLLEKVLTEIMDKEGHDVARELAADLRESLINLRNIPDVRVREFNTVVPQTLENADEVLEHLNTLHQNFLKEVRARLVRAAGAKRKSFIDQILLKLQEIEKKIADLSENIFGIRHLMEEKANDISFENFPYRKCTVDHHKAEEIFNGFFLKKLPEKFRPKALANEIRQNGFEIIVSGIKQNVSIDDFSNYSPQVLVDGLSVAIAGKFHCQIDPSEPIDSKGPVIGDLWKIDFGTVKINEGDLGIFWESDKGDDDIDRLAGHLVSGSNWHLATHFSGGNEFTFCFAGSKIGVNTWENKIGHQFNHFTYFPTCHPNQVTIARSRHGIPLSSLASLPKWREAYELYQYDGWPLHNFKGAEEWQEPCTKAYSRQKYELLFDLALEANVLTDLGTGAYEVLGIDDFGRNLQSYLPYTEEYKLSSLFYEKTFLKRSISRDVFMDLLERCPDLREDILFELKKPSCFLKINPINKDNLLLRPLNLTREDLINMGLASGLIIEQSPGHLHFTIKTNDPEIDGQFFEASYHRIYPDRNRMLNLLRNNSVFYEYMLWEVVESMMDRAQEDENFFNELKDRLKGDYYPPDLKKELADFLR